MLIQNTKQITQISLIFTGLCFNVSILGAMGKEVDPALMLVHYDKER